MKQTSITISHIGRKTIIENDQGVKWTWTNVDDVTAIAAVVFFSLKSRFEQHSLYSDNIKMEFTIKETFYKVEKQK